MRTLRKLFDTVADHIITFAITSPVLALAGAATLGLIVGLAF